ncbi:hypothetical protein L1987_57571 [Smallanthus sonchifolius]|uniref:Uncharacterized protein n=1 Tax=Smallanthus sonchifolius TaxID=185202 RepID=A0ACB9DCV4_9ASTR|nr:hypothetical protein L1987_57571 [Smallanthus sonchifolius]
MQHTRSQGSPDYEAYSEPEQELRERTRKFHSRLSELVEKKVRIPIRIADMGNDDPPARRTVHQRACDCFTGSRSSITRPNLPNTNTWQIPSHVMNTISNSTQFHGLEDEDAPGHLSLFVRICDTFRITSASDDTILLRFFPFTLSGHSATWLDTLPQDSITTWADLKAKFFKKYYPPSKAARLRDQIHSFRMDPDAPYHMAWERFNTLLSKCPHHGLSDWALVENFYNGLTFEKQHMFNTAAGGHIMDKKENSTASARTPTSATRGVHHVTTETSMAAALAAMAKEIKDLKMSTMKCEICRGGYDTIICPVTQQEQADCLGNQKTPLFNSGWRNYPNSNWRCGGNLPGFQNRQNQYGRDREARQNSGSSAGEKRIEDVLATQTQFFAQLVKTDQETQYKLKEHDTLLRSQQSAFLYLQRTVGDIALQLTDRSGGSFSGSTETNPKATLKAVTTRSGKGGESEQTPEKSEGKKKTPDVDLTRVPYPARLMQQKYAKDYGHFLELFKQLKINLPFVEALKHMPKYAKFLKDLLSNKKKLEDLSTVTLNERCHAVVQNKPPEKLADPGVFMIPCLFGSSILHHAFADLGASINLMPYSLFEKLGLGDSAPTRMSISLADRSVKYPRGIVENLLVKVDKFVFPADFVILDMEVDDRVPLILGRPFLRTAKALIDVFDGKITLRVGDENVTFDVMKLMKHSSGQDDSVFFLDTFIYHMDRFLDYVCGADLLNTQHLEVFEVAENSEEEKKPSVEAPPSLELKELPSHLEYAFLDGEAGLPVVISAAMTEEEKERLIEVLKVNKQAIAWKLTDIKGISPTFCTHRIFMEEEHKPVVQPQRRLNQNMLDVVKKEVLKLLDVGLIYPISDSTWVSPTQVVQKKGGMTVVKNEKNALIPTRTVTGWRVCIDYRRLNDATRKDHFPLPFIDQISPLHRRIRRKPPLHARTDMIETSMEVFMDDFFVFGSSFDHCLQNLEKMMMRHKVSRAGIEVDRAKIDTISSLPLPTSVKLVRSFLGHAGFYRRFIKDFLKITRPMTRLLEKDFPFEFDADCLKAFKFLKEQLVCAPILISPYLNLPFELMCDASDYAVGAVLGQRREKHFHPIYYASKTLNDAQENYTTTEKEFLAVVFAFDKFRSYLVLSKTIVYTDYAALRYLFTKKDAKPRLIRWILFLSEFDIKIKDKKGAKNVAAGHLSRLEDPGREEIREEAIVDTFPHESLMMFSDIANYLADGLVVKGMTSQQRRKFFADANHYIWDAPHLFHVGADRVQRRCVSKEEGVEILKYCHEGLTGGHNGPSYIAKKGIDFMGPFPISRGNRYILVAIDYVSKWVEAQVLPTSDARVMVGFLKKLFSKFGTPRAIISDRGTHFCNSQMEKVLPRYGVTHRLSTAYHPQSSGQVENANRGVKRILGKTVGKNRKDWSNKLDDAHWAFRTAFKTPIGTTPFRIIYGKVCHLPVELEHKAYWDLNAVNLDLPQAARHRFLQLHELDELRDEAYARSWSYKERTKALHDLWLKGVKDFKCGDRVLLYNSRLKLFPGKLKSRWTGPYTVKEIFPYGTVELQDGEGNRGQNGEGKPSKTKFQCPSRYARKLESVSRGTRETNEFARSWVPCGLDRLTRTQSPFGRGMSDRGESSSAPKRRRGPIPALRGDLEEPRLIRRAPCVIRYAVPEARPTADADPIPLYARVLHHHTLLRFDLMTEETVRLERFVDMELYHYRGFDWGLVEELGQIQRLREFIDARWTTALACDATQYMELTVEFHTTFRYVTGQFEEPAAVSFALGRHVFEMSVPQFAVAMGWYTEAGLRDFWNSIADGPYSSSLVESSIRDPIIRYIHRILACTLIGRRSGIEKCSQLDLFRLYCIVGRREANLASILISSIARGRRRGPETRLELGPYITRLAECLGVFDRYPGRLLTPGPDTIPYGSVELRLVGIIAMDDPPRFMEIRLDPKFPPPAGTPADLAIQMGRPHHDRGFHITSSGPGTTSTPYEATDTTHPRGALGSESRVKPCTAVQTLSCFPRVQYTVPCTLFDSRATFMDDNYELSSDSKEQELSIFIIMEKSKVRTDDLEEKVTATLQSFLDFPEKLEAKQSKELEE